MPCRLMLRTRIGDSKVPRHDVICIITVKHTFCTLNINITVIPCNFSANHNLYYSIIVLEWSDHLLATENVCSSTVYVDMNSLCSLDL